MRHAIILVTVEPARRHRCESCKQIFECHLCGIEDTHPAHHMDGLKVHIQGLVFVCKRCCRKKENRFQQRKYGRVLDLLTGVQV